jgi:hypothetical protein
MASTRIFTISFLTITKGIVGTAFLYIVYSIGDFAANVNTAQKALAIRAKYLYDKQELYELIEGFS